MKTETNFAHPHHQSFNIVAFTRIITNTIRLQDSLKYLTLNLNEPSLIRLNNKIDMFKNEKSVKEAVEIRFIKSLFYLRSL